MVQSEMLPELKEISAIQQTLVSSLKTMSPSHLVLNTAQLGLIYGIANQTGQPDRVITTAIIREACDQGIREFDTAQGYGTIEEVLGKALYELGVSN